MNEIQQEIIDKVVKALDRHVHTFLVKNGTKIKTKPFGALYTDVAKALGLDMSETAEHNSTMMPVYPMRLDDFTRNRLATADNHLVVDVNYMYPTIFRHMFINKLLETNRPNFDKMYIWLLDNIQILKVQENAGAYYVARYILNSLYGVIAAASYIIGTDMPLRVNSKQTSAMKQCMEDISSLVLYKPYTIAVDIDIMWLKDTAEAHIMLKELQDKYGFTIASKVVADKNVDFRPSKSTNRAYEKFIKG